MAEPETKKKPPRGYDRAKMPSKRLGAMLTRIEKDLDRDIEQTDPQIKMTPRERTSMFNSYINACRLLAQADRDKAAKEKAKDKEKSKTGWL
jgi:hypothetical protein